MKLILLLTFLISSAALGADGSYLIDIAPARQSIPFNRTTETETGCVVTMDKPQEARVMGENETHFDIEWTVVPTGCFQQRLGGQKMNRGIVRKSDIIWQRKTAGEALPMITFKDRFPEQALRPAECLDNTTQYFMPDPVKQAGIAELINYMRHDAGGMKQPDQVDKYLRCYPENNNPADYLKYRKFLNMTGDVFRLTDRTVPQEVNPSMLSCLYRRESGFNVNSKGATGLGQHTGVNIKEISGRLRKPGSWERALWNQYFEKIKKDPEGRAMLAACPGSGSSDGMPVFDTKEDAKCPLQSIAAGSIYVLMIQRELQRTSKTPGIEWESELDYQTAVAAAYNLGDGASGVAVRNLRVNNWVDAIRHQGAKYAKGKDCEVMLHVNAVRNCMQAKDPWQPMHPGDKPVCAELKGLNIQVKQRANTCDTGLNQKTGARENVPAKTTTKPATPPKKLPAEVKKPAAAPAKKKN